MFVSNKTGQKLNVCISCFLLLVLVVTGFIFYNSIESPDASNKKSNEISKKIQTVIDPQKKISDANFKKYTRKAAHVAEFSALGVSLGGLFYFIYKKKNKLFISLPLLLGTAVAVLDEYIQSFNKRTSKVSDILIDFGGLAIGMLLVFCICFFIWRKKMKKRNKNCNK